MKKIKRNYQKAIYSIEAARVLFFGQRGGSLNPRRWTVQELPKWWRFVLVALLLSLTGCSSDSSEEKAKPGFDVSLEIKPSSHKLTVYHVIGGKYVVAKYQEKPVPWEKMSVDHPTPMRGVHYIGVHWDDGTSSNPIMSGHWIESTISVYHPMTLTVSEDGVFARIERDR